MVNTLPKDKAAKIVSNLFVISTVIKDQGLRILSCISVYFGRKIYYTIIWYAKNTRKVKIIQTTISHQLVTIKRTKKSCQQQTGSKIYVVVQLYPWFKFISFLFKRIIIHYHTQKQKEIKFEPG